MALRHQYAIASINTADVFELCKMLALASQDAIGSNVHPHMDPACRLIGHHISFVLNGDLPTKNYYEQIVSLCMREVEKDKLGLTNQPKGKNEPEEPVYKAS